jgi:formylmethanofuran dehydrogenase subunit E
MADPRLDYYLAAPAVKPPPAPVLGLLVARKAELEATISKRFREAREAGAPADTKALGRELREVRTRLAALKANGGEVEPGRCSRCGSDAWVTGRWLRGKTVCSQCLENRKTQLAPITT